VLEDDILAVSGAHDAVARQNDAAVGSGALQNNGDRSAYGQRRQRLGDAELQRHGLLAQRQAAANEFQRYALALGRRRGSTANVDDLARVVGDGLDPQLRRIDDFVEYLPRLDDLPADHVRHRYDSGRRRADRFPVDERRRERLSAPTQTIQLPLGVVDLPLRYAAFQLRQASHPLLGDGDAAVQLGDLLSQTARLDGGDHRHNVGEHLAARDPLPEDGQAALRRLDPAGLRGLNPSTASRIGDHPTDDTCRL
jgi:hypothetical protein